MQLTDQQNADQQNIDQLKVDTPEQIALEFPLAGVGSRFLALAVDTLLQVALYFIIFLILVFVVGLGKYRYLTWIPGAWGPAVATLFFFCIYWGYFALFELLMKGQTPGKMVAGIRVIHVSGRPINVYESIGRNFLRAIDSIPGFYLVAIISVIISPQNRRLGDYVAGTVVVHDKRTEETKLDWNTATSTNSSDPQWSQVTPEELMLIETFLQRRFDLDYAVRDKTAFQIATRISQKTGVQRNPEQSVESFLEMAARQVRDSARFR